MGILDWLKSGLGQIGQGIRNLPNTLGAAAFPVDPNAAATMDPALIEQQRRMALARLGLGLSGASAQGAPFGQAALYGLGQGAEPFDHFVATAYSNTVRKQEADQRKQEADTQDARYQAERDYQIQRDKQALEQKKAEDAALAEYRKGELENQRTLIGQRAVGSAEDQAKAARIKALDVQVQSIIQRAQTEKRDLSPGEKALINAIRGQSFGSIDPLMQLLMGGGLGGGGGPPVAPGPTSADVMHAFGGQ